MLPKNCVVLEPGPPGHYNILSKPQIISDRAATSATANQLPLSAFFSASSSSRMHYTGGACRLQSRSISAANNRQQSRSHCPLPSHRFAVGSDDVTEQQTGSSGSSATARHRLSLSHGSDETRGDSNSYRRRHIGHATMSARKTRARRSHFSQILCWHTSTPSLRRRYCFLANHFSRTLPRVNTRQNVIHEKMPDPPERSTNRDEGQANDAYTAAGIAYRGRPKNHPG